MKDLIIPQKDFSLNEECGVVGIISTEKKELARDIYFGLYAIQHRGQESAGIAVEYQPRTIAYYKNLGLVSQVFGEEELSLLPNTKIGIGQVRYSTSGSSNVVNAQPIVFYGRQGRMAIAYNGNIVNAKQIRNSMLKDGHIFQSSIDCEVISTLINVHSEKSLNDGIIAACNKLVGAYAILLIADSKLYAIRDKHGLKPMVMGKKDGDYVFASESCALDAMDAKYIRDVAPGEVISIDASGHIESFYLSNIDKKSCIFEYVYLARSDSVIDSVSVYESRYECGRLLAKLHKIDADIVAGVPDSALVCARGYSDSSGIPYVDALTKNRYVGRTFIQPSQAMRERSVKIKLSAFRNNIEGKRLILIDDSIVRGTTSKKIIQYLRQNGVKEIHMLVASPVVKNTCYFGVDIETPDLLIGGNRSVEEIRKEIGADSLSYLPLEELKNACHCKNDDYCMGCFDNKYPIDISLYK